MTEESTRDARLYELQAALRDIGRTRDAALHPLLEERARLMPRLVFEEPETAARVAALDVEIADIRERAAAALQPVTDEAVRLGNMTEQELRDTIDRRLIRGEPEVPPFASPAPTSMARLQGLLLRGEAWVKRKLGGG